MVDSIIHDAERLLENAEYLRAERQALKALTKATKSDAALADRATTVLLQALYETNRFSSAKPILISTFGSMTDTPPMSLLLWLSLALDTDEKCQAQNLMLHLLQSSGTGGGSSGSGSINSTNSTGWSRRQYLALLHVYVVEILLPALRDPTEVKLWLQRQTFLPLDIRERHFLEEEVDGAAAERSGGGAAMDGTGGRSGGVGLDGDARGGVSAAANTRNTVATAGMMVGGHDKAMARTMDGVSISTTSTTHPMPYSSMHESSGLGLSPVHSPSPIPQAPSSADFTASLESDDDEEVLGGEQGDGNGNAAASYNHLDWLGRWHQSVFSVADSLYDSLIVPLVSSNLATTPATTRIGDEGESSSRSSAQEKKDTRAPRDASANLHNNNNNNNNGATTMTAATAAAAIAFMIAVYNERNGLKRAAGRVWRGFSDLMYVGLSFQAATTTPPSMLRG